MEKLNFYKLDRTKTNNTNTLCKIFNLEKYNGSYLC